MRTLLALVLLVAAFPAGAEPLQPGDHLAAFAIEDQRGNPHTVDAQVRAILFARDMKGGDVLEEALADSGAVLLAEADAVYVANISGMPAVIRSLFALPSLKRRGYPMLLDSDGELTRDFPGADDKATLIQLLELEVVAVTHYESGDAVRSALRALAGDSPGAE